MLKLVNIQKRYPNFSLQNISIEIEQGDYYVLLGKSGSGKSMLLEMIAGVRFPDSGQIILKGKDITALGTGKRNCILVYQDNALFPHMTVYENIAFTLKSHKVQKSKRNDVIQKMAGYVSIEHLLKRMPLHLSGGEAQRVALARALVVKPDVLLLDEPLSALDTQLRSGLQSLLRKINREGQTIVQVTHDFKEAVSLANKVALIDGGNLIQVGTATEVFQNPRNEFVAGLSGVKNFLKVKLFSKDSIGGLMTAVPENTEIELKVLSDEQPGIGYLTFNSSDVIISENRVESSAANNMKATVIDVIPCGNGMEIIADAGIKIHTLISRVSLSELQIDVGKSYWFSFKASACRFISSE
jgi:ABC-type sugar transport system ATPase subunit